MSDIPTAAAEIPLSTFAGTHGTSGRYGSFHRHQDDSHQRFHRPTLDGPSRYQSARSYGEAWGKSRRTGPYSPGIGSSTWTPDPSQGEGPHPVPPTSPRYNHSRPPWNRPHFNEDSRSPRNRPYSMEDSTGPNIGRDPIYLSDWASRMGQARSQPRVGDDRVQPPGTEQNASRYVPPHARPGGNRCSEWRGSRSERSREDRAEHRDVWETIQRTSSRRPPATTILPTSISEPDESNSRPSNIIQDEPRVQDRRIESVSSRGPRVVDTAPSNTNQSPGTRSGPSTTTPAAGVRSDTAPQPELPSSGTPQSAGPSMASTNPIPISSPPPGPANAQSSSIPQPAQGGDFQTYLAVLLAVVHAASTQNHQGEPAPGDPTIAELRSRLSPPLEPISRQHPNFPGNTPEEPDQSQSSPPENTSTGNDAERAPLTSLRDDSIPAGEAVNQGTPRRPSIIRHTENPERARRAPTPTAVHATVPNRGLRSSVSAVLGSLASTLGWTRCQRRTGSMADAEGRASRPSRQADISPSRQADITPSQGVAPHQDALPQDSEFRRLAQEVTSLLELCARTDIDQNDNERQQLMEFAIDCISRMRGQPENSMDIEGEEGDMGQQIPTANVADDSTKVDAACIVCFEEVANTVLLPCNHLVLCIACCDTLGIVERGVRRSQSVPCPMCRQVVEYRIKIFRG